MHFDYHAINSSTSRAIPITILELASNIITDWMPGTPNSLSRGFVDLLSMMIESRRINGIDQWVLKPDVAQFEKQWKQVTSWILGIAFCKKVIEMEGYTWLAPVSAFTSQQRRSQSQVPYWTSNLPLMNSRITHPIPRRPRLMPDYVLARSAFRQKGVKSLIDLSYSESNICT